MTLTAKQRRGRSDTRMSMVKVTLLESLRVWVSRGRRCFTTTLYVRFLESGFLHPGSLCQWFDRWDRLPVLPVAIAFNLFALQQIN
jgi:hypothetical protein